MKKFIFLFLSIYFLNAQWQIIWQENFEQGLPQEWQVIDGNNDGYTWQVGNPGFYYPPPGYGTKYAYYNDDEAGPTSPPADESLISPSIFTGDYTDSLRFTYGYCFNTLYFDDVLEVKIRVFTQGSWTNYDLIDTVYNMGNGTRTIDISNYIPCDSVQFMFHYSDEGYQNYGPGIDNLKLERKSVGIIEVYYPVSHKDKKLQIFDITGRRIKKSIAFGEISPFKEFGKGIYILKLGGKTYRIIVLR